MTLSPSRSRLHVVASGLGVVAECMLGHGNSSTRFRYIARQFGALVAPSCCYGERTASRASMPSPHLERKLKETLGDDAGEELAAVTDRIDPIRGDIAELRHGVRGDIAELRHGVRADIAELQHAVRRDIAELRHAVRGDIADLRLEMEQRFAQMEPRFAQMDGSIERSAKEQTRFLFVAWGVLLAAIVGLYGTVVALLR